MKQYINKSDLVTKIERLISNGQVKLQKSQESNDKESYVEWAEHIATCIRILSFLDTLEIIDPYAQQVQYPSVKDGIQAHAETYSFNIESELFNQLTKEQQKLWRKEIEQAYINGGEAGVELARDTRYKENLEVKEVDLERAIDKWIDDAAITHEDCSITDIISTAKHFFELGLKVKEVDSTAAFIEKACEWLKFNYVEFTDNSRLGLNINELIKDFKKAMEE